MSADRYNQTWIDFAPAFESAGEDDGPACDVPPWLVAVIVALEPGLDDAAWRRILVFFAAECIQVTLDIAGPLQTDATQAEWDETYAACTSILAALRGEANVAAAADVAGYAARNLAPEVVSYSARSLKHKQQFMMASGEATWAMKCAADTANWVGETILKDPTLILSVVETALCVRPTKEPYRLLGQRLALLISTEFAAAKGWCTPLSFS
jgi:hypothetical protein